MTDTHHAIIKADQRGRLRFTPDQRATLLAAYDTSGLSGPKFAQLHGLNYQTFAGWLQRRKRGPVPKAPRGAHPRRLQRPAPGARQVCRN